MAQYDGTAPNRILRWGMRVTDQLEVVSGPCRAVAMADNTDDVIEFWTTHWDDTAFNSKRYYLVVGTGHPIPMGWKYEGTGGRTPSGFVWHLISRSS